MNKLILILSSALILSTFTQCNAQDNMINSKTVENFDLEKYLGTWYEIARFDHRFERNLQGVTATYSYRKDGKIKVLNQGYKGSLDGKLQTATGKAKLADSSNPAHLKVSFFLFFYGDYFVLELGEDYEWALIGTGSDDYLWILSRTPQMEKEVLDSILKTAEERGYDLSGLIMVEQKK